MFSQTGKNASEKRRRTSGLQNRRIVPKGTSINVFSQDDIEKAFGNVDAIPRPQYYDKTSAQMFITIYGEEIFKKLGGVFVLPKDCKPNTKASQEIT